MARDVKATVTLVHVQRRDEPDGIMVTGGTPGYWLPGAGFAATVAALRGAGFEPVDSVGLALDEQERRRVTG